MIQHLRHKEIKAQACAFEPEDEFAGWLKLTIWLGLGALSWVPIIAVMYLMM